MRFWYGTCSVLAASLFLAGCGGEEEQSTAVDNSIEVPDKIAPPPGQGWEPPAGLDLDPDDGGGALADADMVDPSDLAVGKTAPDIEGEDIDGVQFKLSDYRGKVVLLDFWGHW